MNQSYKRETAFLFLLDIQVPGRCPTKNLDRPSKQQLHIWLKQETVKQASEASEINLDQLDLLNSFGQQDRQLHHIAMLPVS